jgi:hypothetical protein
MDNELELGEFRRLGLPGAGCGQGGEQAKGKNLFHGRKGLIVVRVTRIFVQVRSGMIGISGCQERGIFEKRERFYVRLLVKH